MSNEDFEKRFGIDEGDFYITAPAPCPYLAGKRERKIFAYLGGREGALVNSVLTNRGFRRSQNVVYVPACDGCNACVPVRVDAKRFAPSKSQRRVETRNKDLVRKIRGARATGEQFSLLRGYLDARHHDGGMADMTVLDYASMVEETNADTLLVEYRIAPKSSIEPEGELIACALIDRVHDGLSMVYSFFEPEQSKRSLGKFMIADAARLCAELGLDYVYLGYWVNGSQKMGYKAEFKPIEQFQNGQWVPMAD